MSKALSGIGALWLAANCAGEGAWAATLVDNTGAAILDYGIAGGSTWIANKFTMGGQSVVLTGIAIYARGYLGEDSATVRLCSDSGNQPGSLLEHLGTQALPSSYSVVTFNAAGTTGLGAGTSYWVVVNSGGDGAEWAYTATGTAGSYATIDNRAADSYDAGATWPTFFAEPYMFALYGTPTASDQTISNFLPTNGSVFVTTDTVGLSATASSGLAVTFAVGSGPGSIAGGTNLSFTGAGSVTIVASQAGDASWNAAPDETNAYAVGKAPAQVYLLDLAQTYDGGAKNVTATTMPAGLTVEFTYDGNAWAPTNTGTYAVTGTVNDANYEGLASGPLVVANNAPQGTDKTISVEVGQTVTIANGDWGFGDPLDAPPNNFTAVMLTNLPAAGEVQVDGAAATEGQVVSMLPGPAGETWTARESNRPWSFVASSSDGTKLVAAALNGQLYTSTDSGETWTARESSRSWNSLASSADGTKLVAVVRDGQLYTSTDSGATWTARENNRYWTAVVSSADGTKLVAAVYGGRLYTSTDSGTNWTARDSSQYWSSIASSADGTKLVAAVDGGQIYTSTDSGTNWTARESNRGWESVASSADGTKLVAGVWNGQLYTSTDSGTNWTARDSSQYWSSIASSADGTRLVAAAGGGPLYTSTDSGTNWTARESDRAWQCVASSADGTKLVAAVFNGQLYTSVGSPPPAVTYVAPAAVGTYTLTFQVQDDGVVNNLDLSPNTLTFNVVAPEIGIEQPAGAALTDGVSNVDFGVVNVGDSATKTFTVTNSGGTNLVLGVITVDGAHAGDFGVDTNGMAATLAPGDTTTFDVTFTPGAAGARTAAVHVASNDGDEDPFDVGLAGTGFANNAPQGTDKTIAVEVWQTVTVATADWGFGDPDDAPPNNFTAVTLTNLPAAGEVRVDGAAATEGQVVSVVPGLAGETWIPRESDRNWYSVASSADGTKLVAAVLGGQLYTSTDSGETWTPREENRNWVSVASSADGTRLVAAAFNGQLYTSTDSGTTWTGRESDRQWWAVASSADGTKLVAAARPDRLYVSSDAGETWAPREDLHNWYSVASSADGTKLVAVELGGLVFTSTDSGTTWIPRESDRTWRSVASSADGTKLVAAVEGGQLYTSTDSGATWTARESDREWRSVASSADGSKLVAAVDGGQLYSSKDSGATWIPRESNRGWCSVASSADGSKLVAAVYSGQLYTSVGLPSPAVTYTAPAAAGTYTLGFQVHDDGVLNNLDLSPSTLTFDVTKAPAEIYLLDLTRTYDGTARTITATTMPAGLTVEFTYDGSVAAPTDVGTYAVTGTVNDASYAGSAAGTLTVGKGMATVVLGNLSQTYDGAPKPATATTVPAGLAVNFTYDGMATAPTVAGSYAVTGTVNDASYAGAVAGTLTIGKADQDIANFLPADGARFAVGARAALGAQASSGLPVEFVSLTPDIAQVAGATVRFLAPGVAQVQAVQGGDANRNAAAPVTHRFQVTGVPVLVASNHLPRAAGSRRCTQVLRINNAQNPGGLGIRVLFSRLKPGVTVRNRTGFAADGNPVIEVRKAFRAGGVVEILVTYDCTGANLPSRFSPRIRLEFMPLDAPPATAALEGDYDGDGRANSALYHARSGHWNVKFAAGVRQLVGSGRKNAVPVQADYDGDGLPDFAVFTRATGDWHILRSSDGTRGRTRLGGSSAIPVPGDYDGDGKHDPAIFNPRTGRWQFRCSAAGSFRTQWGLANQVPVPADYDGDGATDLAVFDPATGRWQILKSGTGRAYSRRQGAGALPVPADYDGDGQADLAAYWPATGEWRILRSSDGQAVRRLLKPGLRPAAADYDGDGKADMALFDLGAHKWYIRRSATGRWTTQIHRGWQGPPALLISQIHSRLGR